jgi:hypothetical protein
MKTSSLALIGIVGCLIASAGNAGQFAYPAKGQDAATQAKDEADCSTWATQQTGLTPGKVTAPTGTPVETSAVISALGGLPSSSLGGSALPGGAAALLGSGAGGSGASSISGLAGGGLNGAMGPLGSAGQLGGVAQAAGMANRVTAPLPTSGQADYAKARAACLTGRGYSVQ